MCTQRACAAGEEPLGRHKKSITQKQLEVLSARVTFDLYKRVEVIAQKSDLTLTQVLRLALKEFVVRHDPQPQARREVA